MSTSNSKCLLCQKPLDISSESRFILLMQTFLSNFCWLSTSFLTPLDKITIINRTQKILAQNKSNKPQQENKSNKSKSENKPNQVNMRHTRPNQQLKGSVFDKIQIFENKNSKPLDCKKKTVIEALAEQKIGHANKHEVEAVLLKELWLIVH